MKNEETRVGRMRRRGGIWARRSAACKGVGPPDSEKGDGRKWRGEVNVKPHSIGVFPRIAALISQQDRRCFPRVPATRKKLRPRYLFHHIPRPKLPQTPHATRHSIKNKHSAIWNSFGIVMFGTRFLQPSTEPDPGPVYPVKIFPSWCLSAAMRHTPSRGERLVEKACLDGRRVHSFLHLVPLRVLRGSARNPLLCSHATAAGGSEEKCARSLGASVERQSPSAVSGVSVAAATSNRRPPDARLTLLGIRRILHATHPSLTLPVTLAAGDARKTVRGRRHEPEFTRRKLRFGPVRGRDKVFSVRLPCVPWWLSFPQKMKCARSISGLMGINSGPFH